VPKIIDAKQARAEAAGAPAARSPAARLLGIWAKLKNLPGGAFLFHRVLRVAVPYTASVRPLVREIRPGYARVQMLDRPRLANHLQSIHAIALANVGEFTGGIAMTATAPPNVRSILVKIEVDYLKKARGRVTAECHCTVPPVKEPVNHQVVTHIRDEAGDEVARVTATWRLSPL
jgi:acyl-coenzyme A thioesterase PaaI-like protein